jgi:precorrin-2/cobalt-factor-2 C20-methyltransferase
MTGCLYGVGMGPGDPDLVTVKAAKLLADIDIVAYFAKAGHGGHARRIAQAHVPPTGEWLRLEYPFTTEVPLGDPGYARGMAAFYDDAACRLAEHLDHQRDVALLCEGDPLFYGSFMYIHDRLVPRYECKIIPGITGMSGCWSRAQMPMVHGNDILSVLPATLPEAELAARLAGCDAAVIMKIGRHMAKIRSALTIAGRAERAVCVERGTMIEERIFPVADATAEVPYFSLVLVPGRRRAR